MERFEAQTVVVGAGVAGLAIAQNLARAGHEVLVIERGSAIAMETSSRNSEVIHAGLYYATGSLKARFCVEGRRALYQWLDEHNITYNRCGKLVVAIGEDQASRMDALMEQARINDVEEIDVLSPGEALALEPALNPALSGALRSGTSGIFDSHGYFLSLEGRLEDHGGMVVLNSPVLGGEVLNDGIELEVGGDMPARIVAQNVINAAGHGAIPLAQAIDGPHQNKVMPRNWFVKGSYFTVSGKTPFSRLIYPMHTAASLGLHLTIDLGGRGKLGPDAEWLHEDAEPPFDYKVDPARADVFYDTVRSYWPGLPDNALAPDYSGVRPKLVGPGEPSGDFMIQSVADHGSKGLINLFGIESPGLTSSLAIADYVAGLVETNA